MFLEFCIFVIGKHTENDYGNLICPSETDTKYLRQKLIKIQIKRTVFNLSVPLCVLPDRRHPKKNSMLKLKKN